MSTFMKEKEQKIMSLTERIDLSTGEADEEIEKCLDELEKELPGHPYVVWNRANLLCGQGDFAEAKRSLLKLLEYSPFYFAAHFSLMLLFMQDREFERAFRHYARAVVYAETDEDRRFIAGRLKISIDALLESGDEYFAAHAKELLAMAKKTGEISYSKFPLDDGGYMLRKKIYAGRTDKDYLVNVYKLSYIFSMGPKLAEYLKFELLEGTYCEGETEFQKNEGDLFAFSTMSDEKVTLEMFLENRTVRKDLLTYHTTYYFNLPENGPVRFKSEKPYFISQFKSGKVKDKPELVLNIFIQDFSFALLKEAGFEKIMPNTAAFFSEEYIADRCMSAAEQSLSACMSLASGKYAANHGLVNPNRNYDAETANRMIQEYFYDAGYMTARICGLYEMSPNYGYYKKNSRTLYAHNLGQFYCDEVVAEAIEHLEVFEGRSNFLWLSVQDLHDVVTGFDNDPLAAVYKAEIPDNFSPTEKRYLSQLKKIDFYLSVLYRFIERKYGKDRALIVLNSDIGPGFLQGSAQEGLLRRLSVPFMLRGAKAKYLRRDGIVSSVDILPTVLDLCGLSADEGIDGQSICKNKRDLSYTDSLVPFKPYRASLFDKDGLFTFETAGNADAIGQVGLFNSLLSNCGEEKAEAYTILIYEHMKKWIKL